MVFNIYCVPNSPSTPTAPTESPTWVPVSWTPLVDIPGMPTGKAPLGGYLISLYNFLLGAVGIIAMMMLVYGGFRYMTSAGNSAAMGDAKDIVYSAIIGLALALVSYLIISTINPELLFAQDPKLATFEIPEYSTNLPANSCSYNLPGFEPDHCRCIGDDAEKGGDTTCEFNKSDYDDWCNNAVLNCGIDITGANVGCKYGTGAADKIENVNIGSYLCASTGNFFTPFPPAYPLPDAQADCVIDCAGDLTDTNTCSGICKSIFCATKPKCCIKVDLRVGKNSTEVTSKSVEINAGGFVFFDALSDSYSCKYPITAVSIDAKPDWLDKFGQHRAEYEERIGDYPCRCGIGTKGECNDDDEWCNAKPGRFVLQFNDTGTYYPKLRLCIGADEGGHVCTDITEGEKTHDEAVTVTVK